MSYSCQRCRQSLQISPSLVQPSTEPPSQSDDPTASPSLISLSAAHSQQQNSLSSRLAHSESLHSILDRLNGITPAAPVAPVKAKAKGTKGKSRATPNPNPNPIPLEHPLCTECTSSLLEIMRNQVDAKRRQRDAMVAWKQQALTPDTREGEDDKQSLIQQIQQIQEEYQASTSQLREAEKERLSLEEQLRQIELQEQEMEAQELEFWATHRSSLLLHSSLSQQTSSLEASISNSKTLLNRLNATDVYNDVFSIGQDSGVATINGLRLGRSIIPSTSSSSSDQRNSESKSSSRSKSSAFALENGTGSGNGEIIPIEWPEINAAWGQTALLMETLRNKLGIKEWENGWKIFPRGSYSWLEKVEKGGNSEKGEKYELYNNSNWELGKLLHSRRFDNAMVGFLDCLRQLGEIVERRSEEEDGENGQAVVKLPHIINKDRIGGASIKLQFGNDETWTRALRHVLLTLRILLSWVVKHTSDDD